MAEKSNFTDLFWILMAVLLAALAILGGVVTWKLLHTAAPQVEQTLTDPDAVLATGTEVAEEKEQEEQEPSEQKTQTKQKPLIKLSWREKAKAAEKKRKEEAAFWARITQPRKAESEDATEETQSTASQTEQEAAAATQETTGQTEQPLPDAATGLQETLQPELGFQPPAKKSASNSNRIVVTEEKKPRRRYASYVQGLIQCQKEKVFPCAWDDIDDENRITRYWLYTRQGPVERKVYARDTKRRISQTFATLSGEVVQYNGAYAQLHFERGLLTQIRTFPYANPNLRDWFLIDQNGRISACLCGIPTKDCCSRCLLYRQGSSRSYCDLFPRDADFCRK